MNIKKSVAVALFAALGFPKAAAWDNDKLTERLEQLPEKVEEDKVPDEHKALLKQISEADGIKIEDDGGAKGSEQSLEERAKELGIKGAKGMSEAALKQAIKKAEKGGKKSAVDKAVDKAAGKGGKKEKKEKAAKPPKDERPRDAFGCVEDSIRAKVNAALSADFKGDAAIAEEAGVTIRQARIRLRRLTKKGVLEKESVIQYRLAKDWKKKLEAAKDEDNDGGEDNDESEE